MLVKFVVLIKRQSYVLNTSGRVKPSYLSSHPIGNARNLILINFIILFFILKIQNKAIQKSACLSSFKRLSYVTTVVKYLTELPK